MCFPSRVVASFFLFMATPYSQFGVDVKWQLILEQFGELQIGALGPN